MSEGGDLFSEKVIAELEAQGLTINWRYGYRLANRYEVKRVCAGGMGIVFIAEDLVEKGKKYAIKTLKTYFRKPETEPDWRGWEKSANDFLRECNVWVDLGKHRHIVHAEYLEKIDGVPLVMSEFIDGGSLDGWLERGPLETATALDFAIQACIGMEYANKKGVIVHRDIKPGNILVTRDGVAKINDFGIAKALESAGAIRGQTQPYVAFDNSSLLVSRGMGTPPYMAPEQFPEFMLDFLGYPVFPLGVETDIYAFGLVLYEMITSKSVVKTESDQEMEIQREVDQILSRPNINPGYSPDTWAMVLYCFLKALRTTPPNPSKNEHLNAVILKCLAKEPSKRYHSFTELKEELMRLYREEAGREFQVVDELAYEPNWRNMGKTCWVLGREKESLTCYDKAIQQNVADTVAWLDMGLAVAETGNLEEFGLCMEIIPYLKPSRETEVQQCKEAILDEPRIRLRDMRLLDRLALDYPVPDEIRDRVSSEVEQESRDPFHELNAVLLKLLEELKDGSPSVRENAAKSLGKLGDRSVLPTLMDALNKTYWAREAAIALGELGDRLAVPVLIKTLRDESPMRDDSTDGRKAAVREMVATALGKLGDRSAVPALIAALNDSYRSVRWEAATALGKLGDRSATPALIAALNDQDPWVRQNAALALGKLGDRSAMPLLVAALKGEDDAVRENSALALGELGDWSAVPLLIAALNDQDYSVREKAAEALGKLGDGSAVPALIAAFKDEYSSVRENAAEALGKLGDRLAVQALIEATKDKDHSVRDGAVTALGELGDQSAAPALIAVLKDEDTWLQWKAARALGKLGDGSAVPALIAAVEGKDPSVRSNAAIALGKLGDRSAVPALIAAFRDELERKHAEEEESHGYISEYGPKTYRELELVEEALCKLGDRSAVPELIEALASFPEPNRVFVVLRWACSQPDRIKLSQAKDKHKEYSAFEWYTRGSELATEHEYEKALKSFEKAVEVDPDWEVPKKARDECLKKVDKGMAQPAIGEIEGTVPASIETQEAKLEGDECVEWLRKGTELFNLGKYAEAMECYDKALKMDSGSSDAWYSKGRTLDSLSKYEEAAECYDKALEIDSGYVDAWYSKGIILDRLGKHQEAIECFDKALKIDPTHGLSWYNMGYALSRLNRREEAIQCYDRALNMDQRDVEAWYSKGYNLATLGRYEKAIQCYDQALKVNPRYAYAWAGKGIALHQLGKRKEAMKCLHKALEIDPSLRENLASLLASE